MQLAAVFNPQRAMRKWLESFPRSAPLLLFLVVAAVTILTVVNIERSERVRARAQLSQHATEVAAGIERSAMARISFLEAGAAMFTTLDAVPAPLFTRYAAIMQRDPSHRGARGLGWSARLDAASASSFELAMKEQYGKAFRFWPSGAPLAGTIDAIAVLFPDRLETRRFIGFDMRSEKVRRAAMDKAELTGRPAATGKVSRIGRIATPDTDGFIIFMPVYSENDGRRSALRGFLFSSFRAGDFLKSALGTYVPFNETIRVYDMAAAPGNLMAELKTGAGTGLFVERNVSIADRLWILRIETAAPAVLSTRSMTTLLTGLTIAVLLLFIARIIQRGADADKCALAHEIEQTAIRSALMRELNHRVKNTLANVLSIIVLTRRRATDLDSFVDGLSGRIRALSATHDVLTRSEWGDTPLREIVAAELAPYLGEADARVLLDGPDIRLAPSDALSFGLAVHELSTNAAKYGALSTPEGRVHVDWQMLSPDRARVSWRESDGPPVNPPQKRGFGSELIEKIVAHELRSEIDLRFDPAGVECTLTVPVRKAAPFKLR